MFSSYKGPGLGLSARSFAFGGESAGSWFRRVPCCGDVTACIHSPPFSARAALHFASRCAAATLISSLRIYFTIVNCLEFHRPP